jgi:hypothetical protein
VLGKLPKSINNCADCKLFSFLNQKCFEMCDNGPLQIRMVFVSQ